MRPTTIPSAVPLLAAAALVIAAGAWLAVSRPAGTPAPAAVRPPAPAAGLAFETVARGLRDPVHLTAPPEDPRLFVVEQPGRIRVIRDGHLLERPFLALERDVGYGGERGLLSLAFHPRYRENGLFFVNYTDRSGDTRVERFRVGPDPDLADPSSRRLVLRVEQPFANHNGGHILFGPDGMLYVGMGDGGSAGDPHGHSQDLGSLLGKLLRLDVDRADPYGIPTANPFASRRGARGEIWALGLRNPWRMCFDQGLLYIADVGQNRWEEINVTAAGQPGLNYGWNRMEGRHCFRDPSCDMAGLVMPAVEYGHGDGCSVTGGAVYRGALIPALRGHYLYADYCSDWIRSFRWVGGVARETRQWGVKVPGPILSFGSDRAGELYLLTGNGGVYRIVPARSGRRP